MIRLSEIKVSVNTGKHFLDINCEIYDFLCGISESLLVMLARQDAEAVAGSIAMFPSTAPSRKIFLRFVSTLLTV